MDDELIDVVNKIIGGLNLMNKKLNDIQDSVTTYDEYRVNIKRLNEYFSHLGDFGEAMQQVLTDVIDKHDTTNDLVAQAFYRSSEFFKETISDKYAYQNIMQEWFSDIITIIIAEYTKDKIDLIYARQWLDLKFKDFVGSPKQTLPSMLEYMDRVNFGETIFQMAVDELEMSSKGMFILRTLFIPYTSLYYLKPMINYPKFETWLEQIQKFKECDEYVETN